MYKRSGVERISFGMRISQKMVGSNKAGFGIQIAECPDGLCLNGQMSMTVVDEQVDWAYNGWSLNNMVEGSYLGMFAFDGG